MKTTGFYLKNGQLTRYALACGYCESFRSEKIWVKLFCENAHFHVMKGNINSGYSVWETFGSDELTKARILYKKLIKI